MAEQKTISLVGLGLIGGSVALDCRAQGAFTSFLGVDNRPEHARQALSLGLVDEIIGVDSRLFHSDVILLAIPVKALSDLLPQVLDRISRHTVVIDTGSTKQKICSAVASHPNRAQFVAAHPIAGTENSGPLAALKGLFKNKTNIICEREKSSAYALAEAGRLFGALEMNTIYMEPEEHDRHVAYVSHLSHVSAFLLGQTVLDIEKDEKNILTWPVAVLLLRCGLQKVRPTCGLPSSNKMPSTWARRCWNIFCTCNDFNMH